MVKVNFSVAIKQNSKTKISTAILTQNINPQVRFVAFPATEYDVLLGYQPGQMVER
jgi:hypothetical protein